MATKTMKIRRTSIRSTAASPDSRETSAVAAPATDNRACRQASFHAGPIKSMNWAHPPNCEDTLFMAESIYLGSSAQLRNRMGLEIPSGYLAGESSGALLTGLAEA